MECPRCGDEHSESMNLVGTLVYTCPNAHTWDENGDVIPEDPKVEAKGIQSGMTEL